MRRKSSYSYIDTFRQWRPGPEPKKVPPREFGTDLSQVLNQAECPESEHKKHEDLKQTKVATDNIKKEVVQPAPVIPQQSSVSPFLSSLMLDNKSIRQPPDDSEWLSLSLRQILVEWMCTLSARLHVS